MKKLLITLFALAVSSSYCEDAKSHYSPTWQSLQNYKAPEWYGRWMYIGEGQTNDYKRGQAAFNHHQKTYGGTLRTVGRK